MNAPEYLHFPLELRAEDVVEPEGVIGGYASTWIKDAYGDRIAPGAFADSIAAKKGQYPIHAQHDIASLPIGFTTYVAEDAKGLAIKAALALNTTGGRDAFEIVKHAKKVDYRMGLSVGFRTETFEMDQDVRVLTKVDLWEISLTAFPANRLARVEEARSLVRNQDERSLLHAIRMTRLRLAISTQSFEGR